MINRRFFIKQSLLGATAASFAGKNALAVESEYLQLGRTSSYKLPAAFSKKTGLKIKQIETYHQDPTVAFVHVITDKGADGWGQIAPFDADISATVLHRKIAPVFLGKDPADLDTLVDLSIQANYKWPWSYHCRALGGIDTAIWDLMGKLEKISVCELLGGKPRPFPVYGSSMSRTIKPKEEAERFKKLQAEKGFAAFKIRVGKENGQDQDQWPGRTEELIPAVRKAVGKECRLLADGNSCFTPPRAIEVGKHLEDQHFTFLKNLAPIGNWNGPPKSQKHWISRFPAANKIMTWRNSAA